MKRPLLALLVAFAGALLLPPAPARAQLYTHTEARHTHSVGLTPDGTRLLALNTNDARLCVFDLAGAQPVLTAEIPVGLEPVSLRARTDDEVWVVSELGDSIAIVSLSRGAVIQTLAAPDEPADIVFAQGKAFVSCARNNLVRVFDAATRQELATIPLQGLVPQALATDAAGTRVFAAFLHSGNGTTILPRAAAPTPPAPTNPLLSPPPKTAVIVPASDPRLAYTVLDRDVAEIDPATLTVTRYLSGTGTNLFDLSVQPGTGDLWIANTEALNLTRFEPNLRGHFVDHRLTRVAAGTGAQTIYDLNPGIDYELLPNPAAQATSLAQPSALLFSPDGAELWVAAFGSDRIARLSATNGAIVGITELRGAAEDSRRMRGPRALALDAARARIYVLNKLANTLSVLSAQSGEALAEVPIGTRNPMPPGLREGRGFLFDARLSGNGTASCASCHLDADRDGLAWDLGDPSGTIEVVMGANLSAHDTRPRRREMHPMKGPMVTQTLRGLAGGAPFHWRGDRATLQSFNPTFANLLGGAELPAADMDALAAYLNSLRHHPNPNRALDNTLPATLVGGNPTRGRALFTMHLNHCSVCHTLPRGTDNNIDIPLEVGAIQPLKNPSLATTYQRFHFNPQAGGASLTGFGLGHDGSGSTLPTMHPYVLDQLRAQDFPDVAAFVLCFETGTAPSVGGSVTVTPASAGDALEDIARLEAQHQASALDLVVRGVVAGEARAYIFSRSLQLYVPDRFGEAPLSRSALLAALGASDSVTFLGVPPGEGGRFGGDLERNATLGPDSYFTRSKTKPLEIGAAIGVLANDLRVSAPVDAAALTLPAGQGTVELAADGSLRYLPAAGFGATGSDRFSYRVLIGGDPENGTAETTATVSTFASAAGGYFGLLEEDGTGAIAGFVKVAIASTGAWSGTARVGGTVQPIKGTVAVDGTLQPARAFTKLDVALRLSAQPEGQKRIRATARVAPAVFVAELQRSPFSRLSPAPGAGRHQLTLTVASATAGAPTGPGTAVATIGKLGTAKLAGRLGDRTAFSLAVPLAERAGGGWRLPVYASVFRLPPGSVTGNLSFDPELTTGLEGSLTAVRPPQTKPAAAPPAYTIRYDVSEVPIP